MVSLTLSCKTRVPDALSEQSKMEMISKPERLKVHIIFNTG